MSVVWDLRIVHDRFGSSSDPSLRLVDKIRKYHTHYNNNPTSTVSFMSVIVSTSGRLHSEFIRLLFLQSHRETDRFFAVSGTQVVQKTVDYSTSADRPSGVLFHPESKSRKDPRQD